MLTGGGVVKSETPYDMPNEQFEEEVDVRFEGHKCPMDDCQEVFERSLQLKRHLASSHSISNIQVSKIHCSPLECHLVVVPAFVVSH